MARSVIVTGGFGVLGQAVAEAFAAQGDKVARLDFAPSPAKAIEGALDIGGVDLTDAAATQVALDQVVAAHGGIDVGFGQRAAPRQPVENAPQLFRQVVEQGFRLIAPPTGCRSGH